LKPDVLRWRQLHAKIGEARTLKLWDRFRSKGALYKLPSSNTTDRTWARSIFESAYVPIMEDFLNVQRTGRCIEFEISELPLLKLLRDNRINKDVWWTNPRATRGMVHQKILAKHIADASGLLRDVTVGCVLLLQSTLGTTRAS